MSPERRSNLRQSIGQEGMLSEGMHFRLCKVRDLSLSGAFLEIGWAALSRDKEVDLTLTLSTDREPLALRVPARVARISTEGAALRFELLDPVARDTLSGYLGRHAT